MCCRTGKIKIFTTFAREGGIDWERRKGADSPGSVGFVRELPQVPMAPVSDSFGLVVSRVLEEEGKWGGGHGLLIAVGRHQIRQGMNGNLREGVNRGGLGLRRDQRREEEDDDAARRVGPTRQRAKGETEGTGSGFLPGLQADSSYWAEGVPGGPFIFFLFFFFSFSVFLFLL
jgi:hypothetical protein